MTEYMLRKDNVLKVTASEVRRDRMIEQGYVEVEQPKAAKKDETPKGDK